METRFSLPGEGRSVWVAADRVTFKSIGDETHGAFAVFETLVPPGGGTPPHVHTREDELFYVLEGEVTFRADGNSFTGRPGCWVTLPRGTKHQFLNLTQHDTRMLIIATPAGIEKFFEEIGTSAEQAPPVTPDRIAQMIAGAVAYGIQIEAGPTTE